jgi:DNA-binding winged helix-turn-helix (wHTH) protein
MTYRFGDCELDVERHELRVGGVLTAVEPQVFDVLAYLVVHRDKVVTKEELLDNVWGDRFVSESALTSRIKSARRAVADTGQSQHVIRTVHGRGYRFVAHVETEKEPAGNVGVGPPALFGPRPAPEVDAVPNAWGGGQTWPFLGRVRELESIGRAFRDGETGGVLLTGRAGVGKTRLADECLRLAGEAGVPVARVSCHPETKPLPLAAVAHLLPADVARATGPEGQLDRGALFHRARAAIEQVTSGTRAMVLVDDVDQLDDLSRALLVSLVHARTVFVAATLRTPYGIDDAVALLVKDGHMHSLDVAPLGAETAEALLHRVIGGPMEEMSLEQLVEASMGNPGVLRQLVESARDTGNLVEHDGVWHLDRRLAHASPTFELLVEERLAGLSETERDALELLSVAGELPLVVLASIVDEAVLERLERRGLLQAVGVDQWAEVTLAHPLFAEVLRNQLPTVRSRRLRRTLADAVSDFGANRPSDQFRVVAWRLEAGGHVDAGLLAEAARLALIDGDDAMAERILDRADSVDRTPDIVQLLAELKFRHGETEAVEQLLASIDQDELDDPARAQLLRRRATNLFFGRGQFLAGVELLNRALDELVEPTARRGVEAYHVLLLTMAGLVSEAIARSEEPMRDMSGAPRLELLRGRALALAAAGRGADALALVAEGRALHESLPADLDRPGLSLLLFTEVVALCELGQLDDAAEAVQRWRTERPERTSLNWIALADARVHLLAGRPAAVTRGLGPLVRSSHALGHEATERWALAMVASARLLEGDVPGATDDLARVAEIEHGERGLFHTDIDRAHGWLAAELEGLAAGCSKLHAAAAEAARSGRHAFEASLLHDIARFGDPGAVAERLGQLAGTTQGALVRARAAHAAGASASDAALLDDAATTFEQCGTPLLAAEAATNAADCLARHGDERGAADARARAARLLAALPSVITTPILAGTVTR